MQALTFVLASLFRVSLFSLLFVFIQTTFGFASFGRLTGCAVVLAAAIASATQIEFVKAVNARSDESYESFNIGFLCACAPLFAVSLYLRGR